VELVIYVTPMKSLFEVLTFFLKLAIAAIAPLALLKNMDFLLALMAAVSTLIAVWPKWFLRRKGYTLPLYVDFMVALSLFLHNWGVHFAWYPNVPYFDRILHVYGTAVVGVISFFLIFSLNMVGKLRLGFWGHVILTGMLALALGAFWEIGEYAGDTLLHINAQHGNSDTMGDLILDAGAGFLAAIVVGWSLKFIPAYRVEEHFAPFIHFLERLFGHHKKKSQISNLNSQINPQLQIANYRQEENISGNDIWKEAPISAQEISSVAEMFGECDNKLPQSKNAGCCDFSQPDTNELVHSKNLGRPQFIATSADSGSHGTGKLARFIDTIRR
jgi:hypothetical protein